MIRLFILASKNLRRSLFRTVFTIAGASVALIAFMMLRTVLWAWNVGAEHAAQDRIATRHKVTFVMQLPKKYIEDIRAVPGVKQATWANWFGAKIPTKPDEFFANMAVDGESYLQVIDEMVITPEDKARWMGDKKGALVGKVLAKKMGWKVGDKVVLEGTIYPGDWEFVISGIYSASKKSLDESQFIFHWSYFNDGLPERRRDEIGWVMSRIENGSRSGEISQAIDKIFDEREVQTVTMSERNMQVSFMAGFSSILKVLELVSIVILGIMLLILGNTMAMAVRERDREFAVLRAIGYEPFHIRLFVLGEAVALGLASGLVGVGAGYLFVTNVIGKALEENMGAWFPYFRVSPEIAITAMIIAMVLSLLASLLPSMQAGRGSVIDALRRVG